MPKSDSSETQIVGILEDAGGAFYSWICCEGTP
jgi:hypothetical protein